jgi:hypothetical protein
MESIISTLGNVFLGMLGGGSIIAFVAWIMKRAMSGSNARALVRKIAPALDKMALKVAGSEADAEKLESVYVPFLKDFFDELIIQLQLDNKNAQSAIKKAVNGK